MVKGWKSESARHSLARKGIKTGRKTNKKTILSKKQVQDEKTLKDIEETFNETAEATIEELKKDIDEPVQLTYGFVPQFRDLFTGNLDERYNDLSPEADEQVSYLWLEMLEKIENAGWITWGDEGDGTVVWAGSRKAYEKQTGEKLD